MDFGNDEDETRDDYRLESGSLSAVDCMVFLVDASPGMRAAIQDTVRALANVLAEKIRSPRDLIGSATIRPPRPLVDVFSLTGPPARHHLLQCSRHGQ